MEDCGSRKRWLALGSAIAGVRYCPVVYCDCEYVSIDRSLVGGVNHQSGGGGSERSIARCKTATYSVDQIARWTLTKYNKERSKILVCWRA